MLLSGAILPLQVNCVKMKDMKDKHETGLKREWLNNHSTLSVQYQPANIDILHGEDITEVQLSIENLS
jgi:hypothetical protein